MPTTVKPSTHSGRAYKPYNSNPATSASALFQGSCLKEFDKSRGIIQTSFSDLSSDDSVYASKNGFVLGAISAYSNHHHLVLRPEDIWFSILTQLSFYINAHAEELRSFFVPHQGQEDLIIEVPDVKTADYAIVAEQMTYLLAKKVNDPDLREFVMPDFSTTTNSDKVVAAILFMGAMQKYFRFGARSGCGIPSVTLQGERADWQMMLQRLEKIPKLGEEAGQFHSLLKPVLTRFVRTFDEPESPEVVDFWTKIAHQRGGVGCLAFRAGLPRSASGMGKENVCIAIIDLEGLWDCALMELTTTSLICFVCPMDGHLFHSSLTTTDVSPRQSWWQE